MAENKNDKTVSVNRKAFHTYEILETVEAGIALTGTEIKSVRAGRVSIAEAFAKPEKGEVWLLGANIARYDAGSYSNHDPTRPRKLLLHREQIANLGSKVAQRGFTLVPLKLYITRGRAKIELGLGRGKKAYDKRESIKEKDQKREMDRAMKSVVR
ncbi:MAG: SsrA-binding protein SmpB [Chloroflexi bacterium]|nr:SsrA-binding protein SmpB [Chloroflexota bacterium]